MSLCESKISTEHLALKEPCKSKFPFTVYRQALIKLGRFQVAVTTTYRIDIKPIGFALGRHLYSVPLTPGEKVELEVFRSAKVERELSQQYSTEVEFVEEFSHACKYEWSRIRTSNYTEGGGVSGKVDLGIIEFGGHYEPEYSETEKTFEKVIDECILKTKYRVDRKFDIHVGLKTEVENRYRSTRKIKNPNICRTLTYNYFQLMRKFKITVTRIGIHFDWVPVFPRIMTTHIPAVIRRYAMPPPELKTLVANREEKPLSKVASNPEIPPISAAFAGRRIAPAISTTTVQDLQSSAPDVVTVLHPIVEEPRVLELTKERLLTKMDRQKTFKDEAEKTKLDEAVESLRVKFPVPKVVSEREVCVNTNSMHVEAMMGSCLACEEHVLELRKLELEKAKAELERAKRGVVS